MESLPRDSTEIGEILALCHYTGKGADKLSISTENQPSFSSQAEANSLVRKILGAVHLAPNFIVGPGNTSNAAAGMENRGSKLVRVIVYNPSFIRQLVAQAGTKWAATAVLAHEIGHHLQGHTLESGGSRPPLELEADEFAGSVLHMLGATLDETIAVVQVLSPTASATHPGREQRRRAMQAGWRSASGPASSSQGPKAREITRPPKEIICVTDDQYLSLHVWTEGRPETELPGLPSDPGR